MSYDNNNWALWVKKWISINLLIIILVTTFSFFTIKAFRENFTDDYIVTNYENILYGSAVEDSSLIKLDIVKQLQPNIIAIGSSRVMQFRKNYFYNQDFYTLGGLAASLDEARYVYHQIKAVYTPKVVILGVDLWWLNPKFQQSNRYDTLSNNDNYNRRYAKLLTEMKNNPKILQQLLNLSAINKQDSLGNRETVGLTAAVYSDGYRLSDGSYQYGRFITHPEPLKERFQDTHNRIDDGNRRFDQTNEIDINQMDNFLNLIREMRDNGTHVIVFLPPFPNEIYTRMYDSDKYHDFLLAFEKNIQSICNNENVSFFDCSNLIWLGASDEETIDGFHGSELAYGRIINKMAEDKTLAPYINLSLLQEEINNPVSTIQMIPCSQ